MSEIFINQARTVAITGHRVLQEDFNVDKLKKLLTELINKDFNTFLVGMALGFDTVCFQVLEELRKEYDIKIIACIPCLRQDYKFNFKQKQEYERMVNSADEKIILSENYYSGCMQKRNRFMVDNSCAVLAYIKRDFGGTANTINYAKKSGKPILKFE